MNQAQHLAALRKLWARVPDVQCRGLCSEACGPISMSAAELALLEGRVGTLTKPLSRHLTGEAGLLRQAIPGLDTDAFPLIYDTEREACPLLRDGRCSQYQFRPLVCRLYGAVEALRCPHGCEPAGGFLPDTTARDLIRKTNALR